MTLSIATLSIMKLSIMTPSVMALSITGLRKATLSMVTLNIITLSIATPSITTLSIMKFSFMTPSLMALSIATLNITLLRITAFCLMTLSIDIRLRITMQHNGTQLNGSLHIDIPHYYIKLTNNTVYIIITLRIATHCLIPFSITTPRLMTLNITRLRHDGLTSDTFFVMLGTIKLSLNRVSF